MRQSRLLRAVGSVKVAAVLIVSLIFMALLNVTIPQRSLLEPTQYAEFAHTFPVLARVLSTTGLDALFSGWLVVILGALLMVNLLACMALRLASGAHKSRAIRRAASCVVDVPSGVAGEALVSAMADNLAGVGWRIDWHDGDRFVARRGLHGFWGSMVLHAGMAIVILGGALAPLLGFGGVMVVSEGQQVRDLRNGYLEVTRTPQIGRAFTGAIVSLDSMSFRYEDDQLVDAAAQMSATDLAGNVFSREVRVNHPLDVAGKSYLLQSNGAAVELQVTAPDGVARQVQVNLARSGQTGWSDTASVGQPSGQELIAEMTATPVPAIGGSIGDAHKYDFADPRLEFHARTGTAEWSGSLARGETATLADGTTIRFDAVGFWAKLLVRGQPARWVVYVGFWMCVLGALWRFGAADRSTVVRLKRDDRVGPAILVATYGSPWVPKSRFSGVAECERMSEIAAGFEQKRRGQ